MNKEVLKVLAYMEEYTKDKDMQDSEPMLNAKDLKLILDYIKQLQESANKAIEILNFTCVNDVNDYDKLCKRFGLIEKTLKGEIENENE